MRTMSAPLPSLLVCSTPMKVQVPGAGLMIVHQEHCQRINDGTPRTLSGGQKHCALLLTSGQDVVQQARWEAPHCSTSWMECRIVFNHHISLQRWSHLQRLPGNPHSRGRKTGALLQVIPRRPLNNRPRRG